MERPLDALHLTRILRRRWMLIVTAIVFTLAGAAAMTAQMTPVYVADARLYVSSTGGEIPDGVDGDQVAMQRISSYVAIADSPLVAEKVIDRLDLDADPAELAGRVSARS